MTIINLGASSERVRVYSVMPSGQILGGERVIPKNEARRFVKNARATIINTLAKEGRYSRSYCLRYMQNVEWVMVKPQDTVVKVINYFAKFVG